MYICIAYPTNHMETKNEIFYFIDAMGRKTPSTVYF